MRSCSTRMTRWKPHTQLAKEGYKRAGDRNKRMATSDPETMWIQGQDQFGSVCWRNMKTCVIRYAKSSHKGLSSGTHPNTPSIEFYPNPGYIAKKDTWTKHTDDKTKNDYWHNNVTGESTWNDPKAVVSKPPPPPPPPASAPTKTSAPPGPPAPPSSPKKKEKKDNDALPVPPGPPGPPGPQSSPTSSSPSPPKYEKREQDLWSRQIDEAYGKVWYNEKTGKSQVARPDCLKKYK